MQQGTATRAVVFGGLMAALTIALAGPLGPVLPTVLALPIGLAYARYGWRVAAGAALVAASVCLMLYDWYTVLVLVVPSGVLPGLALGWGIAGRRRPAWIIGMATVANAVGYAVDLALGVLLLQRNPVQDWQHGVDWLISQVAAVGVPLAARWLGALLHWLEPALRQGLLAGSVLSSLILAVSAYTIAYLVYPRLGHPLPPLPPVGRWRLPWWTAVLLVMGLLLSRTGSRLGYLAPAGANVAVLLLGPFALQGLLTATALTRVLHLRGLGALAAALALWVISVFGIALGLADSLLDLRRRSLGWRLTPS